MIIGTVQQQLLLLTGDGEDDMIQAWVAFDASSGTPTILEQDNISSITDNGVGTYILNFSTDITTTTYATLGSCWEPNDNVTITLLGIDTTSAYSASQVGIRTNNNTSGGSDTEYVSVIVVG